jgi:hypothetical protein
LGCGSKRAGRRNSAPGWLQRAKLLARHSYPASGNRHPAGQYSDAASANSYSTRTNRYATCRDGNTTNKPSAGIGRTDGRPAERDDSGRNARIEPAATARQHYTALAKRSHNNSERYALCDTGNAEWLNSERRVVESRLPDSRFLQRRCLQRRFLKSEHIQSGVIAFDSKPGK